MSWSHYPLLRTSSTFLLAGEQHWRNAL
ncbi:hypothetical protein [Citrobacter portucalensis]